MKKPRPLIDQPRQLLTKLHRDERGAEGLEKLLIIAAIVLPLLGLLVIFRDEMGEWVRGNWNAVKNDADSTIPGTGTTP